MQNPIKVKLSLVVPTLTKLTFTTAISDPQTTLNALSKSILQFLSLPQHIAMEFFTDEKCSNMCMGSILNEDEHFYMKIEREEYEKFVAAEMKKNEKKQNGKEESKQSQKQEEKQKENKGQQNREVISSDEDENNKLLKDKNVIIPHIPQQAIINTNNQPNHSYQQQNPFVPPSQHNLSNSPHNPQQQQYPYNPQQNLSNQQQNPHYPVQQELPKNNQNKIAPKAQNDSCCKLI